MPRTSNNDGHTHSIAKGAKRTSSDDGHSHAYRGGAWTAEADGHRHKVPESVRRGGGRMKEKSKGRRMGY